MNLFQNNSYVQYAEKHISPVRKVHIYPLFFPTACWGWWCCWDTCLSWLQRRTSERSGWRSNEFKVSMLLTTNDGKHPKSPINLTVHLLHI